MNSGASTFWRPPTDAKDHTPRIRLSIQVSRKDGYQWSKYAGMYSVESCSISLRCSWSMVVDPQLLYARRYMRCGFPQRSVRSLENAHACIHVQERRLQLIVLDW